jgi:hypothetical protein
VAVAPELLLDFCAPTLIRNSQRDKVIRYFDFGQSQTASSLIKFIEKKGFEGISRLQSP